MDDNQKFRKKILKFHYELSEGNSWNLVLRPEVAKRLEISDYNDSKLLAAIKYLEDKGFLKAMTNVQDQITAWGIDEVEGKFPNLGGEDEDLGSDDLLEKLTNLLSKISWAYDKGEKELLESKKLEEIEQEVESNIKNLLGQLSEEENLKYKKISGGWKSMLKSGFCNKKTAEIRLGHWKIFMEEIIENTYGIKPRSEVYISPGSPYEGRKNLRAILKTAKQKIWLVDNFLHPEILALLEPYIISNGLEIKLLTRRNNNNNFRSFCADLVSFKQQYPLIKVETRENDKVHDRFIIIDEIDFYHSGHSFHDLGKKASQINKTEEQSNKDKTLKDFNEWWLTGNVI